MPALDRTSLIGAAAAAAALGAAVTPAARAGSLAPSPNYQPALTVEHTDIGVGYGGGAWDLHVHEHDANDVEHAPDAVLLHVGPGAVTARSAGDGLGFTGVAPGGSLWRLPQSQDPSVLYLGAAAEEVATGTFDAYNPFAESKGRLPNAAGRYVRLGLVSVTGHAGAPAPGAFSVWSDAGTTAFMSSFDDGVANPNAAALDATDGISADDALWVLEGSHLHFNWGLSEPGIYEVTLQASAYLADGNPSTLGAFTQSEPTTYTFGVGTTAVPEPAAAGLAALVGGGLLLGRRRRPAP